MADIIKFEDMVARMKKGQLPVENLPVAREESKQPQNLAFGRHGVSMALVWALETGRADLAKELWKELVKNNFTDWIPLPGHLQGYMDEADYGVAMFGKEETKS